MTLHKKNKRVFITGGSGFVGANLIHKLVKKNYDVHVLLRSEKNLWRLEKILQSIHIHMGDLLDYKNLEKIVVDINPDYIFHLATSGAYSTQDNLEEIITTNMIGLKNLLISTKDIPYSCFVNTGSSSEYGFKNTPMKETDSCDPVSYYAVTKLAATNLCRVFAKKYNKPIVTFRLFSVYGPFEESIRFIPAILKNLKNNKPIQLTPGNQRRDFIYIDDVVNAYIQATKNISKLIGQVINIGTGKEYTNDEVVHTLFRVAKKTTTIQKGTYPKRSWDTMHWVGNMTKTKRLLQWKPSNGLSAGLRKNWLWFKKNHNYYN